MFNRSSSVAQIRPRRAAVNAVGDMTNITFEQDQNQRVATQVNEDEQDMDVSFAASILDKIGSSTNDRYQDHAKIGGKKVKKAHFQDEVFTEQSNLPNIGNLGKLSSISASRNSVSFGGNNKRYTSLPTLSENKRETFKKFLESQTTKKQAAKIIKINKAPIDDKDIAKSRLAKEQPKKKEKVLFGDKEKGKQIGPQYEFQQKKYAQNPSLQLLKRKNKVPAKIHSNQKVSDTDSIESDGDSQISSLDSSALSDLNDFTDKLIASRSRGSRDSRESVSNKGVSQIAEDVISFEEKDYNPEQKYFQLDFASNLA